MFYSYFEKPDFRILCTLRFVIFLWDFCDPNFQLLSSWKLFQKSLSFTYFNFRNFGVNLDGTMDFLSDRAKLPRMGISVMFTPAWFYTSFYGLILEKVSSLQLLRTSFSITCINLGIFWDHLDSEKSLIWETRILFQRTVFSLFSKY